MFTCGVPAPPFLFSCIAFLCVSQCLLPIIHFCKMSHVFYHRETRKQCNYRLCYLCRHPVTNHQQSLQEMMWSLTITLPIVQWGLKKWSVGSKACNLLCWSNCPPLICPATELYIEWSGAIQPSDGKLKWAHIAARPRTDGDTDMFYLCLCSYSSL